VERARLELSQRAELGGSLAELIPLTRRAEQEQEQEREFSVGAADRLRKLFVVVVWGRQHLVALRANEPIVCPSRGQHQSRGSRGSWLPICKPPPPPSHAAGAQGTACDALGAHLELCVCGRLGAVGHRACCLLPAGRPLCCVGRRLKNGPSSAPCRSASSPKMRPHFGLAFRARRTQAQEQARALLDERTRTLDSSRGPVSLAARRNSANALRAKAHTHTQSLSSRISAPLLLLVLVCRWAMSLDWAPNLAQAILGRAWQEREREAAPQQQPVSRAATPRAGRHFRAPLAWRAA